LIDPESEIRKAFYRKPRKNRCRKLLKTQYKNFFRQAERGNVKRSVSIPIDELRGQVKVIIARIKKKR
jgi:hypothetical protein